MNKKGKTNVWLIGGGIALVVILLLVVYGLFIRQAPQTGIGGTQITGGGDIITTNPAIDIAGYDVQQTGTSVTAATLKASIDSDSAYSTITEGTTTIVPGQTLKLFATNGTPYHDIYIDAGVISTGSFPIKVAFNKNATVTENIYSTTGVVITSNTVSSNQSNLGAGATYNLKDEMTAAALTSTQDMVCIIEASNGTLLTTTPSGITLSIGETALPVKSTSVPVWYTGTITPSRVWLFDAPALKTSATRIMYIGVNLQSTKTMTAAAYLKKTCYSKEWFIDPTTGVATFDIADSEGTLKSKASYTYTVYFESA